MAKPRLRAEGEEKRTAQNMLAYTLETTLRLLHPIIPFITEEIWQALPHAGETISTAPYPQGWPFNPEDEQAEAGMALTIEATRALRNLRSELGIAPGARLAGAALTGAADAKATLIANADLIANLARLSALEIRDTAPGAETGKWISAPVLGAEVFLEIGDALDTGKEL